MRKILLGFGGLLPQGALACAVCYGDPNSLQTAGLNLAIFSLLGFIGTVLMGFAGFFLYLRHKSKTFNKVNGRS